jgi:two-component system alkaline phosphatase synthesis response regulator PhoP
MTTTSVDLSVYALRQAGVEAKGLADDVEFRRACAERHPRRRPARHHGCLVPMVCRSSDAYRQTPGLSAVPVMMLTAKDTEFDTVHALDNGADDYLAKPLA